MTSKAFHDRFKVSITSTTNRNHRVLFRVTPELSESGNVNYKDVSPIHTPGNVLIYGNTSSRSFNLVVKLISRTVEEATENSRILQLLRTWRLPHFGMSDINPINDDLDYISSNDKDFGSVNPLGAPPDVLYLTAYSDESGIGYTTGLRKIPVVLSQLSNTYSSDVDYIPTLNDEPFPVLMNLDVILNETHSPTEYTEFDMIAYKNGNLPAF
jgi:hypothetical protein